jgi:hypothetical protein
VSGRNRVPSTDVLRKVKPAQHDDLVLGALG